MRSRVIVIGGTGGFGQRLVEGLVGTTDLDVVIAARRLERACALAAALDPDRARAIALDRMSVTADLLRASGALAVVDAAGPFQGADYRVARAAIAAGMHYLDLADGRDFVAGFAALDAEARAAGVVALTGASSTPALSCAALDRLTAGWRRIDRVEIAITPGNRGAPRGLAVIRSILSYAGKPLRVFDGGIWATRPGWGMLTRRELPAIGRRWLSLCETPDLDLVPARFAPRSSAVFRAGLELSVLHLGLLIASLPVRAGLLSSLLPLARLFRWVGERFAGFGSDCGGMLVEAAGVNAEGVALRARWSLVATTGDGPVIPTLPALAILRAIAAGKTPAPGARACVGIVDLAAIEHEFARHHIQTAVATSPIMSPFQTILGAGFAQLPAPVRRLHGLTEDASTAGRATITAARNPFAWLLCRLAGLPLPGSDVPVTVSFHLDREGSEYWRRRFAGRRYASAMHAGQGTDAGLLVERFWPFIYYHRLTASPDGVAWLLVKWRLLGIPLPRWTLPAVNCFESGDGERFVFDIDVVFPLIGPVIHYRGWLLPQAAAWGEGGTMQRWLWAAMTAFGLAAAAPACAADPLVLQLKWLPDAQFAGYFVAEAKGFYRDAGLDVTIKPGGPDINPSQILAAGGADVAVDWLASALAARDRDVPVVNIAQIFQHSGLQLTCRRDSGVRRPADLKGKTLAVWFAGNEFPFLAWMAKLGLKTGGDKPDVTVLRQGAGVELLLERRAACISTMSYNEYWQVIDAGMKPSHLVVFRYDDEGLATLEDGLYALSAKLSDPAMRDRLARFVRASVAGWRFTAAPAHQAEIVRILLRQGAADASEPRRAERMLGEVAKLVANDRHGLGYLEPAAYERTVDVLLSAASDPVIRRRPEGAWTHEVWDRAFAR